MSVEAFAGTSFGRVFIRFMAAIMESGLRYRFFGPERILQGAGVRPGQAVLEAGCGTGFFTLPVARLLGDRGSLVAMDILPASVEAVAGKVKAAGLRNVRVVKGDALETHLASESLDSVLMFGVIPAPMLPLDRLLPEMHRVIKPGGTMAVWPPSWVNRAIARSGLFSFSEKRDGVTSFNRGCEKTG